MNGRYAWSTGRDLRDVDCAVMIEVAYAAMHEHALMTKDEHEAIERLDQQFVGMVYSYETGMPAAAFAMGMAPADGSAMPDWG